jgi:hypothetical protein
MFRCSINNNTERMQMLHDVVNNALLLVVGISNIFDFKCENITSISLFIFEV